MFFVLLYIDYKGLINVFFHSYIYIELITKV